MVTAFGAVLVVAVVLPLPDPGTQLIGLISIVKNAYELTHSQDQSSGWTQFGPMSEFVSPIGLGQQGMSEVQR